MDFIARYWIAIALGAWIAGMLYISLYVTLIVKRDRRTRDQLLRDSSFDDFWRAKAQAIADTYRIDVDELLKPLERDAGGRISLSAIRLYEQREAVRNAVSTYTEALHREFAAEAKRLGFLSSNHQGSKQ